MQFLDSQFLDIPFMQGGRYVGWRVLRMNGTETPTMHEMRVVKAKIKCADQELTLEVEDKPGLVVPVDAPFFLSKAVALRGWRAPRLKEPRLQRDMTDWGQNPKATLKGLKRWISNNWVEHVCKLFDFAGDAVFHYARIAATKTYDNINKRWQFDVDGVDHTFDDEHRYAPAISPMFGRKVAITGLERSAVVHTVYANFYIPKEDILLMIEFVSARRSQFHKAAAGPAGDDA